MAMNWEEHSLEEDDDGSARDLLAHGVMEFALSREVTSTAAHGQDANRWQGRRIAAIFCLVAAACVVGSYVVSHSKESEVAEQDMMVQMKVANPQCMPQCPKTSRRLKKEEKAEKPDPAILLEKCMGNCPSQGFLATVEFDTCKADCERKHPLSDKMAAIPKNGPPMEGCKKQCADEISGNFWRVRLQRCSNQCAIKTAAQEVMEQMKYNISTPELKDLETQVISLLKKRITFTKRPDDHPFSFLIYQCKSKAESALAHVLDIPKNLPKPSVIIRPYQPGVHQVVSKVLTVDPGNDLEAVVDVEAMSTKNLEKLADPQTLKKFDQAFEDAMSGDLVMKGLANFHPALPMEYTSSSVTGDYTSMGWHTVCRRDKADQTMNGYGTSQTVNDQTLNSCSTLCNGWKTYCFGFEYRAHEKRCEIWTAPICAHAQATTVPDATFVDFRCFKRCKP